MNKRQKAVVVFWMLLTGALGLSATGMIAHGHIHDFQADIVAWLAATLILGAWVWLLDKSL